MTPRTTDSQSQKSASRHINLVVDEVHREQLFVAFPEHFGPDRQEPRGNQLLISVLPALSRQQVACQLFANELIERFVVVE